MGIFLLILSLWAYIRYSGELRDFGGHIDTFAGFIWEYGLKPFTGKVVNKGFEAATQELLASGSGGDSVFSPKVKIRSGKNS